MPCCESASSMWWTMVGRASTLNARQATQRQRERQHKTVDFEANVHFDFLSTRDSVLEAVRFLGIVNQMVKRDGMTAPTHSDVRVDSPWRLYCPNYRFVIRNPPIVDSGKQMAMTWTARRTPRGRT